MKKKKSKSKKQIKHSLCLVPLLPNSKPEKASTSQPKQPIGYNRLEESETQLKHMQLTDLNGKKKTFRGKDFSYSVIKRGYFHESTFKDCKFVGTRFIDSIFRSAKFENCDFEYSDFQGTIIPTREILNNLPNYPNIRRSLLQSLRKNAVSIGDYESEKQIVMKEIDAKKEDLRAARKQETSYYRTTYGGFKNQVVVYFKSIALWLENFIWGHGEKLIRFPIFLLFWAAILALMHTGSIDDISIKPLQEVGKILLESYKSVLLKLMNVKVISMVKFGLPINILIEITKYLIWGMVAATLYRRLSHR